MSFHKTLSLAALALALAACGGAPGSDHPAAQPAGDAADATAQALPAGHPVTAAGSLDEAASPSLPVKGVVQEVINGGGYTYARVLAGEKEMWVAGPQAPLEVGQEVGIGGAISMGAFSSPSLERSFDELFFVGSFQSDGPPPGAKTGEVLEVLEGGGYTYVRARAGETETWLAGPMTAMAVGDTVSWMGGMNMGEFYSASLEKTFDDIVFVGRFWVEAR